MWLWSEDEQYSLGLADYGFYRGDDVDIIFTCPFDGEEFIGFDPDEVVSEYFEHVRERLQEDEITEDDIVKTIYINSVRYEFEA